MGLMTCGIVIGFVMAFALFVQKIWSLQDRLEEAKYHARRYKRMCEDMRRQREEWETVKCDAQDVSFRKW